MPQAHDPSAARPDHRLFFALCPDTATALKLSALATRLKNELGLKGRPHALERFHVTLHHLGDFVGMPIELRERAEAAADGLRFEPVALRFDQLLSFTRKDRNRPLVLGGGAGLDGVRELQRALGAALAAGGVPLERGSFTPHLTLMYDDAAVPRQDIAPIGWTAGELVLVDSLLGQSRHLRLRSWPLTQDEKRKDAQA
ncbi:2'-5' RNA ligase [Roseateles sp. DAIF2]|uniref:2'-5' RNA ligase family protein n=1 Tax=Roseateles sp. DAIF2 TaxID=2714952 RepID=UPI0018A24987|nr:2'-5' RNA ligase family protein [Roseateles sp. DAIF2]QPF73260.1 2'-5' RNA ligase [Roseateles sp. DAIF2]